MQENNNYILSIVIVNWNANKLTANCLKSIFTNSFYLNNNNKIEVILIDNNSFDNSVEDLSYKFPETKIISNNENLGYAVACNQGMKISKGKYVLLLGNDTELVDNVLYECTDFLEQNSECGAVGCRLVYPDGRLQGNCKRFPKLKNAFFTYLSLNKLNYDYDMLWFDYNKTIEVDQIATTYLMVRNELLKRIGYFDEQYKILYNDVDLCKKIRDSNYKIYFYHKPEIIHVGSHSTRKAGFKIRKIMYKDILKYYIKNFGFFAYFLYPILYVRLYLITIFK